MQNMNSTKFVYFYVFITTHDFRQPKAEAPVVSTLHVLANHVSLLSVRNYKAHSCTDNQCPTILTKIRQNLYGEVNSVKKHNYKIWLNDGVY